MIVLLHSRRKAEPMVSLCVPIAVNLSRSQNADARRPLYPRFPRGAGCSNLDPRGAKRAGAFADETNRYRKHSDRPLSLGYADENGR